jgi:hypothetical protein
VSTVSWLYLWNPKKIDRFSHLTVCLAREELERDRFENNMMPDSQNKFGNSKDYKPLKIDPYDD